MTTFPTLRPATVSITPGTVPATLQAGYNGTTVASTADLVATGDVLDMTFDGLTEAEARSVPDHQQAQRGRSFGFHSATLATALTPAGFQWTYARPVTQADVQAVAGSEFYRLAVQFVGVWIRRASTPSGSTRIVLRTTAARALPAGTPSGSTILRLTTTAAGMATGTPSQSTLLSLKTTPAGLVSTPLNDPLYGSVAFHLPLDAASGFNDVTGRALSVTPQGGVTVETTGGRWGQGSALFDGTSNGWLKIALDQAIGTGDYTVRFWFNLINSDSNDGLFRLTYASNGLYVDNNIDNLALRLSASSGEGAATFSSDGDLNQLKSFSLPNIPAARAAVGTWCFFQQTSQSGNVITSISNVGQSTYIDPPSGDPPRSRTGNYAQTFFDIGIWYNPYQAVNARFSDFQVTLAARPHVVPTGPLPIF